MKIAVCTPTHGSPKSGYVQCLGNLLVHSAAVGIEPKFMMMLGSLLEHQRSTLTKGALEWGADYILWIDDDQTFPPDALVRLLAHGKPLIGCNYARRDAITGPTVARKRNGAVEWVWTTEDVARAGGIEEVDIMGLGMCLVAAEVMKSIEAPQFRTASEDYYFMSAARKAGFMAYVDHKLSWEIGHILETARYNSDANANRAQWDAQWEAHLGRQDASTAQPPSGNQ